MADDETSEIIEPSVDDVAVMLRARLVDSSSEPMETFTANTTPTAVQVEGYITQAVAEVQTRVGATFFKPEYLKTAANLAAMRAAMEVELSYFPEQAEGSGYEQRKELYESGAKWLAVAVRDGSPARKGMFNIPIRPL